MGHVERRGGGGGALWGRGDVEVCGPSSRAEGSGAMPGNLLNLDAPRGHL